MNTKDILDKCNSIIKRQDLDRSLLLFFINSIRRTIFRDKYIYKFNQYRTNVTCTNGIVTLTDLKSPRRVEYVLNGLIKYLKRVYSIEETTQYYSGLATIGVPAFYYIEGFDINLVPMPIEGQINVYGEFWPVDLTDDITSIDICTTEIPEILIYMGCAEYFDMLAENQSAQYWRQKGLAMLDSYMKQLRIEETNGINLLERDPFGNKGISSTGSNYGTNIGSLDGGGF